VTAPARNRPGGTRGDIQADDCPAPAGHLCDQDRHALGHRFQGMAIVPWIRELNERAVRPRPRGSTARSRNAYRPQGVHPASSSAAAE